MFCQKCGKEIEDTAAICPNCGCPAETANPAPVASSATAPVTAPVTSYVPNQTTPVQYQSAPNKYNFPKIKIIVNAIGAAISVIAAVIGIITVNDSSFLYSAINSYGGDAYTGIQNASAYAANNALSIGYMMQKGLTFLFVLLGFSFACGFIVKLLSELEAMKNK